MSIKDFILNKLFNSNNENEQAAMTELEELLLSRIKKAKESPACSKSFQQITDSAIRSGNS